MPRFQRLALYVILAAAFLTQGRAFQRSDWRIAPERINILVGEERTLQALDDEARELSGVAWSINDPSLAVANEQDGRLSLRATKVGALRVTAALRGEQRFLDVSIWADPSQIPPGSSRWGMHAIGRELGDIAAVPTENGPNMLSLEQTGAGEIPAGHSGGRNSDLGLAPSRKDKRRRIDLR